MQRLTRTFKIFVKALRMTLKGEAIATPQQRYPLLDAWVGQGITLLDQALATCDAHGMDENARQTFIMHLEKRDTSMQVILGTVRHNLKLEYPMLMRTYMEHNLTTLYALNMNDQFRVAQLHQALQKSDLHQNIQQAISQLDVHLHNIPPSNQLSATKPKA